MDPEQTVFETEAEAQAFVKGITTLHELLNRDGGQPDISTDIIVEEDRTVVEYGFVV